MAESGASNPVDATPPPYKKDPEPTGLAVSRPNIVLFMPDQLRYDALGCSGNKIIKTPNIDAFAARGTNFSNCFTQASVCSQSRCSMFTGQYPHVAGHRSIETLIKPWEPNVFRALKESGYHVACLAPRGDLFAPTVTELSFDEHGFLETPELGAPNFKGQWASKVPLEERDSIWSRLFYRGRRDEAEAFDYDESAIRSAETWLKNPPEGPWVLFLPLIFPHCPFTVEEPYFSMYSREDMPAPALLAEKTGHEPGYMAAIRSRYNTSRATPAIWAEVTATYYGMITRLDAQFGRLIDLLDSTALFATTITFLFSDHGDHLGDHGLIEKWPSGLSAPLVHSPLLVAGAGLPPSPAPDPALVELLDLTPTLLHLAHAPQTWAHNGASLVPALTRSAPHPKRFAFSEGGFLVSEEPLLETAGWPYDQKATLQHAAPQLVGKAVAVRSAEWTFVWRLYEPPELYARSGPRADPHELHNLAAESECEHVVKEMEAVLLRWLVETGDVLAWERDPRRPVVRGLESPRKQYERRVRERGGAV
ncbi:uncharacterized protein K452DRAFT_242151 [Aplosporella prunicola CBS 121167]|uniref:Sulfatase N-terminal domain-containing protein n=1 Tax=Aplosporella prunicola CBS 121167 TaxID=1176127 RepID=A0A6A6BW55_9PEZI|nr:uncharacterized protein K452DRAFT_242151 [Aplosporella prunicola CBS 121167]KAF2146931.1 hypothetical protein K452DRAFT_242151 [Aplosporella prunicola CBS 121167]